jgi:methyl-accepting chemotaxis protein
MGLGVVLALSILSAMNYMSYNSVKTAMKNSKSRDNQLSTVRGMKTTQIELVLGAMQSIIEKDKGTISEERMQGIEKASADLFKYLQTLKEYADTDEKRASLEKTGKDLDKLVNGIQKELAGLIESSSVTMKRIENGFTEIYNRLKEDADKVEADLGTFLAGLQLKLNMADSEKVAAKAREGNEMANYVSKAVSNLLLASIESIKEKDKGINNAKRVEGVKRNIEFLDKSLPTLTVFAEDESELETVGKIQENIKSISKIVQKDLPALIEKSATEQAQVEANFEKIKADLNSSVGEIAARLDNLAEESGKVAESAALHLEKAQVSTLWQSLTVAITAIGLLIPAFFFFAAGIIKPIRNVARGLRDIAEGEGDLTRRLELKKKDEIGELARWFNTFIEKLQRLIKDIAQNTETLTSASAELSAISRQMSSGAEQASAKTDSVSSAAKAMNDNMGSIAATMEQTSTNVGIVSSSAEEMASTINEIARNSEKARGITGGAVTLSKSSSDRVEALGKAANEISKVTETITEISEQTNLLALNATIEAARAGEAGKGFAVVANEIKELAKQTAEATNEIRKRIQGIQDSISGTITDIEQVPKVINDVNEIVSTIATAVEEQAVTTKEIAANVAQASEGIQEVTKNVTQSSTVTGEIAGDISEVNRATGEMANSSSQVSMSAGELSKVAERLKFLVDQFKV